MSEEMKNNQQISALTVAALDGAITESDFVQLEHLLRTDPTAREYYLETVAIYTGMSRKGGVVFSDVSHPDDLNDMISRTELLREVIEQAERDSAQRPAAGSASDLSVQSVAEAALKKFQEDERRRTQKVAYERYRYHPLTLALGGGFLAALIILLVGVWFWTSKAGRNESVGLEKATFAALTNTINARWDTAIGEIMPGNRIWSGDVNLTHGFAEITFDSGAEVLIQAPAAFRLDDRLAMKLHSGRLCSYVPAAAKGFTVLTPSAAVVDFGTEFGVAVSEDGATDVYVYQGRVDMRSGSGADSRDKVGILTKSQGGRVDSSGKISLDPNSTVQFVRNVKDVYSNQELFGRNLTVNGDFEADDIPYNPDYTDRQRLDRNISIQGWSDNTPATVQTYRGFGGVGFNDAARKAMPIPTNKGLNFYTGVVSCSIWQDIHIGALSNQIDQGDVNYKLSAWLGGWSNHNDLVKVVARFLDWQGREIGSANVGLENYTERNRKTGFIPKKTAGRLPALTQTVRIEIKAEEHTGLSDSYVDNIEFVLTEK